MEFPVMLAPLAGITDRSFRSICRRLGAGMVFTEMVSSEAIEHNSAKSWNLATFSKSEHPVGIQIFSHDPETLARSASSVEELKPDAIDLNFGCPVRKVVKRGAGAGFLEDLEGLSTAVRWVVQSVKTPVTVKIRSGPSVDRIVAVEAAKRAETEGAVAVTVHPRTTKQAFKGKADWKIIAQVKEAVSIPVIGNGDVIAPQDVLQMRDQTGCDAVMIGRGSLGNPWIFSACRAVLKGEPWQTPDTAERWDVIREHYSLMIVDKGDFIGVREMRKHLGWYSRGLSGAAELRAKVFRLEDPEEVLNICQKFFLNPKSELSCE
ncbi:tRNA dihydrouridine synthase DusB [candidate division LCP-89 bacterium B3_LCP]|uniref:tRNA-dihydrouridine synthase n=1 Tax=candidate division LCP-89 bacterium B3_LCP TaxID=2012998 RepID=A0A532V1Z5_UNCL8|nr:MAG: tRNA dihydrouridine synthase DusB [candidate division LCP-89 bacterium B3_LCP]